MASFDVIVVGGGTVGLSAAYHAAARGLSTVVFDQYGIDNDVNSSKGYERMYRILYAPPNRARLVETAYAMWHEMQSYAGTPILDEHPMLFFGYPSATTFEGSLNAIADTMDQLGIPYDRLVGPQAIADRFPVFNPNGMPSSYVGLVQNMGATILTQNSFKVFGNLATDMGVQTVTAAVTNIQRGSASGPPYTVTANGNSYTAQHLILAPGIWLDDVLKYFSLKAATNNNPVVGNWAIWVMTLGYYNTYPQLRNDIPVWYEFGNPNNGLYYGFQPTGQGPSNVMQSNPFAVKISADFTYNTTTNVTTALSTPPSQRIISDIRQHLSTLFVPGVVNINVLPGSEAACNYSMAPDGDMVIGKIPKEPGSTEYWSDAAMFVMASGRGFKFTPLWGRVLVDLAVDGWTAYQDDIEPFSTSRSHLFEQTTSLLHSVQQQPVGHTGGV